MGFSDYFIQTVTASEPHRIDSLKKSTDQTTETDGTEEAAQKSDQEILESIKAIYFQPESNAQMFELQVRGIEKVSVRTYVCLSGWKVEGKVDVNMSLCVISFLLLLLLLL